MFQGRRQIANNRHSNYSHWSYITTYSVASLTYQIIDRFTYSSSSIHLQQDSFLNLSLACLLTDNTIRAVFQLIRNSMLGFFPTNDKIFKFLFCQYCKHTPLYVAQSVITAIINKLTSYLQPIVNLLVFPVKNPAILILSNNYKFNYTTTQMCHPLYLLSIISDTLH